jgi:site-specific recombinase XerD
MMRSDLPAPTAAAAVPISHASDETLLRLWLDGRSPHTQAAYAADVRDMLATVMKPIAAVTLADLQGWTNSLPMMALAPASRARKIGAVKSLLTFAERTGYLPFNVGAALRSPPVKNTLAERILEEADIIRLIALETDKRNHALLRLGYLAGLRVSEICGLKWRDTKRRTGGGQITIFGKGGKTRVVVLPAAMWKELAELRGETADDEPVFRSQKGGALDRSAVHRIVKAAAARAGLPGTVSCHYLRHAHVSHALDRGAPAHLVQQTVGHSDLRTTSRYAHARPNESSASYLIG